MKNIKLLKTVWKKSNQTILNTVFLIEKLLSIVEILIKVSINFVQLSD